MRRAPVPKPAVVPLMTRLPEWVHTKLQLLAAAERRTLNAQLVTLLVEAFDHRYDGSPPTPHHQTPEASP